MSEATTMNYPPFQQRHIVRPIFQAPGPAYPDYYSATSIARVARWYPLMKLLEERFKGGKSFTDLEVGLLIGLREEYESGFERKG